ncbi:hypothetical protein [Streptomyces sp. BK340]|uniref:hypothetical protein n=1 Tax=Streptomyces sp. BK340 TaxID=2572903 RepID=UPI00119F92CC|nr:hypothetical protein [Streptomyces sp. BK340]TVZ90385.1 hypothetical protein FB157_11142 [Streptomyces sp. BK340]
MTELPAIVRHLCDDAAVFPPGLLPLPAAIAAHRGHQRSAYAELVGSFVLAAKTLEGPGELLRAGTSKSHRLPLAATVPGPTHIGPALAAAENLPVSLRALEVSIPEDMAARELVSTLDATCAESQEVNVFVEVPRDERRPAVLAALSGTRYRAKFRTGGVKAELYPDETELAAAVVAAVTAHVPFKATAGLHHAVRNTDPRTGFEQHGFLNLLLATDAAVRGGRRDDLAALLAQRDPAVVAGRVAELDEKRAVAARSMFVSFGTCSIIEPLTELIDVGLIPSSLTSSIGEPA